MTEVALSLILVGVAIAVSIVRRLDLERDIAIAVVRALIQLTVLAAVIKVVFDNLGLSAALLVVMLVVAAWTSGRRLKGVHGAFWVALIAIALGSAAALTILFGTGVFELEPRFLIPIAGMLIGNAMTATSLAGARVRDEITDKRLEVEARLALGVRARTALMPYVRRAAVNSLIPTIDATKNVGLIFLPGAFVGMVIAGASPAEAAKVQLIVMFMLLGAVSLAGMTASVLVSNRFVAPGERIIV
jgi:putative ABC transport system permease protein